VARGGRTVHGSAQRRITGVLLPVEAVYACATIGLMAIDLFTTTGARMNEVMQIRLTEDCIVRLKMPPPPEAKDQSPLVRYILRLIPKGEKADVPQDYFIGEETKRLFVKVAQMLGDTTDCNPAKRFRVLHLMLGVAAPTDLGKRRTCFSMVTGICQMPRSPHACVSSCTGWCLGPGTETWSC
jgi:hypothetical protein